PHAGCDIDAPHASFGRFRAKTVTIGDRAVVVEDDDVRRAFEDQKRFRLRRSHVPMRLDIGSLHQHIKKPMRAIFRTAVKIMIHPQAGRSGSTVCYGIEKCFRYKPDGLWFPQGHAPDYLPPGTLRLTETPLWPYDLLLL